MIDVLLWLWIVCGALVVLYALVVLFQSKTVQLDEYDDEGNPK